MEYAHNNESGAAGRSILVTAATGYIGSRSLDPLIRAGYRVRASARTPGRIKERAGMERVAADAFDAAAVRSSLEGIDTAFYLVHTLGGGEGYAARDREAATVFAESAADAGVRRIIFLGGLGEDVGELSEHLASRHEVGRILSSTGIPVVEFRASIVLGSGSTSFEMIRNLVEKLPVMTTPRWVRSDAQPIHIDDVASYLVAAVELDLAPESLHVVYEIGGADTCTYGDLMRLYAKARDLKRLVIPVPFLSPGLSGWWLYLFTPKQATVGRQLAESLRFPTTVVDDSASRDFSDVQPIGAMDAMRKALENEDKEFASICWADEFGEEMAPRKLAREGRYVDSRSIVAHCPPEAAFDPVACIGGERGWYAFDTLWDIRGFMDQLVGGPGRRRGRKDQYVLMEGDHLEWWRVVKVDAPRLLRLEAEMKLPGKGWLQYEMRPLGDDTLVRQTATFDPKGIWGRVYWYSVLPFHHFVFNGTLKGIDRECRELVEGPNTCELPGAYGRAVEERTSS